jgi:hypothetical protein
MISHRITASALAICISASALTAHHFYGPYPVTLKGYDGDKTNSVSYGGQIARQAMEQSLKKLASKGNGGGNAAEVEAQMMQYFSGPTKDLAILAPASKDGFKVKQTTIGELSSSANLEGKFYKGLMPAWPGNHTGVDVMKDMISRAAKSNKGFDAENGYDYAQLISKFTMGAVQYSQAVDNYLDEKMTADIKPNDMPYKEGKHYTGKEHSWDEGFGYFGAPAHTMALTPAAAYDIAKRKDMASADRNGDGVVDLKSEMVFGPAYYAAAFDKAGNTNYLAAIMQAYIDGRKVISGAQGEKLSSTELAVIKGHAATIEENWEKVLAEAVFKYAGSVYKDIAAMKENGVDDKGYRKYVKHWGELAGFSMAIQSGRKNLGSTAVEMNKLIGFGPVTADNSYVTGVDGNGNFVRDRKMTWSDYQLNMLKIQKLMADTFGVKSRGNDMLNELAKMSASADADTNAETD